MIIDNTVRYPTAHALKAVRYVVRTATRAATDDIIIDDIHRAVSSGLDSLFTFRDAINEAVWAATDSVAMR